MITVMPLESSKVHKWEAFPRIWHENPHWGTSIHPGMKRHTQKVLYVPGGRGHRESNKLENPFLKVGIMTLSQKGWKKRMEERNFGKPSGLRSRLV